VTLVAAFSRVAALHTRVVAALPAPDSNKPLRPPGAFSVRISKRLPNQGLQVLVYEAEKS
jgi:hypothetical protein